MKHLGNENKIKSKTFSKDEVQKKKKMRRKVREKKTIEMKCRFDCPMERFMANVQNTHHNSLLIT